MNNRITVSFCLDGAIAAAVKKEAARNMRSVRMQIMHILAERYNTFEKYFEEKKEAQK